MASPQIEDGYTKIANEIMDALIAANLSGQDFKIALLIIRKTYGFNKCEDAVSLSQMMKATGMIKVRCSQVVNRLELMKILTVTENINGIGKKYKFNKDYSTWEIPLIKTLTVNKKRNRPLMKSVTTKETITKEIKIEIICPEWVPKNTFDLYNDQRKKKLKPIQYPRFFDHLKKICDKSRASPEEILNQSIVNGWEGIFELKRGGNNGNGSGHNSKGKRQTTPPPGGARSDDRPYPVDGEF